MGVVLLEAEVPDDGGDLQDPLSGKFLGPAQPADGEDLVVVVVVATSRHLFDGTTLDEVEPFSGGLERRGLGLVLLAALGG